MGVVFLGLVAAGVVEWYLFYPNVKKIEGHQGPCFLYVNRYHTMEDVERMLQLDGVLKSNHSFRMAVKYTRSAKLLKPGRYRLENGLNNYRLLQKLRNGSQDPVRFTFNNINFVEDFCSMAGRAFHFDSLQMLETMQDEQFLDSLAIRPEMLLGYMLPNTYEIYWTISPKGLILRLVRESDRFWNEERTTLLQERGLEKDEVLIIASIIQKETNHLSEMARMAGVYINRLRIGMPLQADPTVKYAIGDLSIRRLREMHLEFPSPFNTYHAEGLPPGVICAPNPATIDQVLQYEKHDYLYFCAKPGYHSMHTFSVGYPQHLQNQAKYKAWLRKEGIW